MSVARTSSLWGDRASRLIVFLSAGWKPAGPTGKMPVPRQRTDSTM
jgi:hypothetical protein